ncbi:hypothetical protein V1389_06770 [Flavobacterium rakeshii]|uniref:hypothetical protein n=1 Tax=Flavobacterium rakeshii TaxID=1038845 RepID=UPI002E7B48FD|nr:hypothetical protein [Flavobacterium rakeshii]MEE1898029.1 hypothetical protein [Flavobacterium rakeshii]
MAKEKEIVIAKLDIDINALLASAKQAKKAINSLKEQMTSLKKEGKENTKQFEKMRSELESLILKLEQQVKALKKVSKENDKMTDSQKDLTKATKKAAKQQEDFADALKDGKSAMKDYGSAAKKAAKDQEEFSDSVDETSDTLNDLADTAKDGKDALNEFTKSITKMNTAVDQGDTEVKKGEKTFNDYKEQVKDSFNAINVFNGGIGGLISRSQEAGGVGKLFSNSMAGMTSGIIGMTKAAWQFVKNPLGLLLVAVAYAVQTVVDNLKTFKPIVETVEKVTAAAGAAFESIKNSILDLINVLSGAKSIGSWFSDMGENMAEAATEAYKLKGAQQELAKQMELQEIKNAEAQKSIEAYTRASEDQTKTEEERLAALKKANEIEKQNLNERKAQAEEAYRIAAEALANGANLNDEEKRLLKEKGYEYAQHLQKTKSLSDEEIKALKDAQLKRIEIQQEDANLTVKHHDNINALTDKFTDEQEDKLNKRKEQWDKYVDHMLQKQKELLDLYVAQNNGVAKTLNAQLDYQKEYMTKSIALLKEELKQKKISRVQYDTEMKNITDEYKEKTFQATVNFANAELELWKQQNQSKLNNGKEFTAQMYNEELTRLEKLRELQLKTLGDDTEKNAAAIAQKRATNQELTYAETELYTQYLKIQEEYNNAKQAVAKAAEDSEKQAHKDSVAKEIEEIQKKAEAEQLQFDIKMANAETQYQEQTIAEDARYAAEKAKLDERKIIEVAELKEKRDDGLISEDEYKKQLSDKNDEYNSKIQLNDKEHEEKLKEIKEASTNFKLGLASSTFGNLSTILGKESKAGKAMAIAQATIDTYQSAVAAYSSMAKIPFVGPALGAAAAGAAVAAGLANVKKIKSTKAPKAEKGALFNIGGQRHSAGGTMFTGEDGTRFEAEKGELIGVMNRNAARHFMAFNNAFPAGGGSTTGNYFESGGIVSRDIAPSQINMQELANLTAEAVKSIPPPVVAVEDIITQGNSYVQVREGANF